MDKCMATPIRCTDEMMLVVQAVFPCVVTPFPCKYLGIPLSLRRLKRVDEQELMDVVAARIPTWKSVACCLSKWAIDQMDKRRRAFLWAGTECTSGGKCKVAWPTVCRPTCFGGLGILDLRFFGFALRLRWEWLSRTALGSCWATLPSRSERAVAAMAAVSMTVVLGDGCSSRLWTDRWMHVGPLCRFAPSLFAAISNVGKKRLVKDGLFQNRWARDIQGAFMTQVLC
ncbi:uncharacterized protein [Miscanthus floridulus]|uniref:uncharacterized protein n=1 Tax=Miscanthus floridulus TaxID=154761 RepID=UPI003457EBC7